MGGSLLAAVAFAISSMGVICSQYLHTKIDESIKLRQKLWASPTEVQSAHCNKGTLTARQKLIACHHHIDIIHQGQWSSFCALTSKQLHPRRYYRLRFSCSSRLWPNSKSYYFMSWEMKR